MSVNISKHKFIAIMAAVFVSGALLSYGVIHRGAETSVAISDNKTPLYWVAPMDSNYRRDEAGKSPMGMDLIPVYEDVDNARAKAEAPQGTVSISPTVASNLGVERGKAVVEDLSLRVSTVGIIQFDEKSISHMHSRVDGWIESLAVNSVGDKVKPRQTLFELYSPELVQAQEEFVSALGNNNKRLKNSAKSRLQALGVDESLIAALQKTRKVKQRIPFFAPSFSGEDSGYVSMLNVREGMFIKPATELMAVGSLARVWVIAEIFERQADWVKQGQRVRMTVDSYPGEEWVGVVDYLYPILDEQTRTLRARIVFDNNDERLKPNMFAELVIEAGSKEQVVSIPREAVIYQAGMSRVVKVSGKNQYRSVRVYTGIESGERIEIIAGLDEGDEVVISSQFMIDSESSVSAELSRIEGASSTEPKETVASVCVKGHLVDLMPAHRMATIKHEPIPQWSWPEMTMDFYFADSVELEGFSDDQMIEICLKKLTDGGYLVSQMKALTQAKQMSNMTDHSQH